ncbi:hypothetical protein BD770DRAFT_473036 [Pilaira anomala]|nr:hypothetical protein BD770DRAFT_473036 [Pilaira anomala]
MHPTSPFFSFLFFNLEMKAHEDIVKSLDQEFRKVDKSYETSELRVFGENTSKIFAELDVIRRKQINLASDHVSLESIQDITSNKEHNTAKNFDKKQALLKNLMEKLDDLTESMDRFRRISEGEGHDSLVQ